MVATTKGMFITDMAQHIGKELGADRMAQLRKSLGLPGKIRALGDYPVEYEVSLLEAAIPLLYPGASIDDGMRMLGSASFETFANSMFGKVTLTMLASEPRKLAQRVPTMLQWVNNFGQVEFEDLDDKKVCLHYRDYKEYGAHHQGVLDFGIAKLGHDGRCELEVLRFVNKGGGQVESDFDLVLTWD